MNKKNIIDIYHGRKIATLRPVKNKQGYLKEGTIQQIKTSHYDKKWYLKVKIKKKGFINLDSLKEIHYKALGYENKSEYLKEEFNQNNHSKYRVIYFFEVYMVNKKLINELEDKL